MNEPGLGSTGEMPLHSDELRIEKFSLDEHQRRLRQAFVARFMLMFLNRLCNCYYFCYYYYTLGFLNLFCLM